MMETIKPTSNVESRAGDAIFMALGMMMLPPTIVSLPFKLVLFVLVDGWALIVGSIVKSFHTYG